MGFRVVLARLLVRLSKVIPSLALAVMRPDDLVEFSRKTYARPTSVEDWSREELVDSGLSPDETALLEAVPVKEGRLLLLGVGGGREAIHLARIGFEVMGVDFVPKMVEMAKENALRRGVKISGMVQEASKLDVPAGSYDIVWFSSGMYSCVPTRRRRVGMLKRVGRALKPRGYFVCEFIWYTKVGVSPKMEFARKAVAFLTRGNLWYEKGDRLGANGGEFIHVFSSEDDFRSEFEEGGFEVLHAHLSSGKIRGGAVLRKV